ncbi:unnamed protein product, partial [Coccothraustes coccothraustes]
DQCGYLRSGRNLPLMFRYFQILEAEEEKIGEKALLTLKPLLLKLKGYSRTIDERVQRCHSLTDISDALDELYGFHVRGPAGQPCLVCGRICCAAWVALY